MNCIKCGKETPDSQVFCDSCLECMQAYPVKPGTPVQLPPKKRPGQETRPTPTDRETTPAEQLRQIRRMIRWLTAIVALLSLLLCGTAAMLLHTLESPSGPASSNIGKNYTSTGTENRP